MVAIAALEVAITANTTAVEQGFARTNALLEQFQRSSGAADMSFGKLTGSVAAGTVIANAFTSAMSGIAGAIQNAAGATLSLASRLEQARIGFSTMLGGVQQADQFIGQLQQKAESTAFNFPGIQQVAQSFLAMGVAGSRVLPIIDDISNALSAAGHGGDTAMLQRVGQSLSEIQAAGKLSGEQIRELSRDGIAVLPLLAEAFGKTAGEVRKMAEAGEITADKFFAAFHSEVALHYGDIQAQQARTWAVAASNVGDIVGRLATQTFKELTDAATAGALALNDFLHSDRVTAWAGDVKQAIHEVMTALAPLGAAFQAMLGLSGQSAAPVAVPKPIAAAPEIAAQSRDDWAQAGHSVDDYKAKVAGATIKIHEATAAINALSAEKLTITWQIQDIKADYAVKIQALKDEQEGWNVKIQQTKDHYAAILEPLNRMQGQLSRLGEDTKAAFAGILDPLKASLQTTTRQIEDAKSGYEALTRPIQAEIAAIERANQALHKQLTTQQEIADLAVRSKILNAQGDPNVRGDIAAKLLLNQYAQQDLDNRRQLAELSNKKGLSDKAAADFDKQANVLKAEQIRLEQQGLSLIDRSAMAEAERQKIINDAARERNAITLGNADLASAAQTDPLKAKLDAAQAQLKAFTEPLIAQQQALTRAIQDVGDIETATMAPIIKAQQDLARQIQDVNQAQIDALKPMEEQQKRIAAAINEQEAAERAALAPLELHEQSLQRQIDLQEQEKKRWGEIKTEATDALAAIKARAAETAEATAKVPAAATGAADQAFPADATGTGPLQGPPIPNNIIPAGMIADFHELAVNVQASADAFNNLNTATSGGLIGSIGELGKGLAYLGVAAIAARGVVGAGAAIAGLATPVGAVTLVLLGLFEVVDHLPQIQDALGKFWDQFDTRNDEERAADKAAWDTHYKERKVAFDGFWGGLGTGIANWLREAKTTQDAQLAIIGDAWNTYWDTTFPTQLKAFWETTLPNTVKAGFETALGLMPGSVDKMLHAFDPVVNLFNWIADHWPGKNQPPITLPGAPGGGMLQTSFNPTQGRGGSEIRPGDIVLSGGTKDEMIRNAARQFGIDEATFFKQITEESGNSLDVNLTSPAGARGPGQFMPGTAEQAAKLLGVNIDEFWSSAEEQILGAAALMRQYLQTYGNYQDALTAYNAGPGAVGGPLSAETVKYHNDIGAPVGNVMARFHPAGPATRTQFELVDQGLTADAAAAFCGPYAAMLFANAVGRYPTATEAQQLAAKVGWTPGAGMAGIQSELALMRSMGLNVVQQMATPSNVNAALGGGHPIAISTPQHYYEATGGTAEGGLNVGATGTALKGGKAVMTLDEIQALSGPLQGIIVLQDNLTTAQNAGAQAAAVQAAALARLWQIQSGGVASTNALGAAQKQTVTWAQQMADQEAALNATLAQQVPPGRAASEAMKNLGSVLGPVERQIAAGAISADTLRGTLLDLAKSTGLTDKPWQDFATGAMDANAAMDELIQSTAVLGPEFQAVADYQKTAGSSSNEAALRWLLAAQHYAQAKEVLANAPDVPAVPTVAGAGAAGGKAGPSPIDVQANSFDALKPKIDAATESIRNYQTVVQGFDTKALTQQSDAWDAITKAIGQASDGVKQFSDYLDHDFKLKVDTSDVPDWLIPHSPPPLVKGLHQVADAFEHVNKMATPSVRSLDMPSLARASAGRSSGGNTIVVNGLTVTSQATTTRDMAEDIRAHLIQIGRDNGGPDRIFG